MSKVYVFMPARNEEETLPDCLKNLMSQTLPPQKILVINDASTDDTQKICQDFGVDSIDLVRQHVNYVTTPTLAYKMAEILNRALPPPPSFDFMMQHNPDIIIPANYIEIVTERMRKCPRLVVASGRVDSEYSRENHPRGAARIYNIRFWDRYIGTYPVGFSYETFPLLKAQSLGLKTECFQDVVMFTTRPTKQYKTDYGYAMKELGFSLPYVLGKCIAGLPKKRTQALKLFQSYVTSPYKLEDDDLRRFMKYYQAKQLFNMKAFLKMASQLGPSLS